LKDTRAIRDMSDDELTTRIIDALCGHDLTHYEAIALGDSPPHAAKVLEILQATGMIEAYCGPIQPSTCRYKLSNR
jgi:hypothetical protein